MGKRVAAKTWKEMTLEEMDKWWNELIKGVNFNNHEESYNFHMNSPECLICGEIVTHWIPAKADGWLMPVCDKHFNNPKITEKRWAKARATREEIAEEMADLKCYKCGGMPVTGFIPANEAEGWITLDNNAPDWIPLCDECSLAHINSLP
jgi:hypothetical protein